MMHNVHRMTKRSQKEQVCDTHINLRLPTRLRRRLNRVAKKNRMRPGFLARKAIEALLASGEIKLKE